MSSVHGVGANTPLNKIVSKPVHKQLPAEPAKQVKTADKVELSTVKQLMQTLKAGGDIRADKVAALKAQIEAGTYETEARLDGAITRLMDDLER